MQYVFLEYSIDCAHWLPNVPEGHKCGRMHGHRYDIRVEIVVYPGSDTGWIIDYADIRAVYDPVIMALDHKTLNEVTGLSNPTPENIVMYLRRMLPSDESIGNFIHMRLHAIEVREMARAGAGWRRA
jgi:6-pyruvoyltetrahydropterin/6-carboxytetrahydropterin synthase